VTTTIIEVRPASRAPEGAALSGRPPAPPRMPRRPPPVARVRAPLTPRERIVRTALMIVASLLLGFGANTLLFGHLQHVVAQQQLANEYREQLAAGTAPVSEGNFEDVLLPDGVPVGLIEIPSLGVKEVIVEGSSSTVLKSGPGHRRDTVLPGQVGTSILMGRAAAYGGPFGRIQELAPGQKFTILTGQGRQTFEVIGVRYAGDPTPPPPAAGMSRLILQTARGADYVPEGVAYVDAELVGPGKDPGQRLTRLATLPPEDLALAGDTSTVWALVFALQFLLAIALAAVWAFARVGAQKTWVVFAPATLLAGLFVANQVAILLPNLM